jgi:hypothetical protein
MPWYKNRFKPGQQLQADQQGEPGTIYHKGEPVRFDVGDYIVTDKHGNTYLYPKLLFEEGYILET